jgi:excinuclease ABC subunit B
MSLFQLSSHYQPAGDQPEAIETLTTQLANGKPQTALTLLGATGTGKTFTMANVITRLDRPALVMAHNKTLAAQLYNELKEFFPYNAVEYFISYYDYYQPEAYIPRTDTYIEKTASINDEIDRLRHRATKALFERRDVIVVASVSCIYGLGLPEVYLQQAIRLEVGAEYPRNELFRQLVRNQYQRNDIELKRSGFRVRGDIVDVHPADEERVLRLSFFDDELEMMTLLDPQSGEVLESIERYILFPAVHYVTDESILESAIVQIKEELKQQVTHFVANGKLIEAQRLEQRTLRDLEMLKQLGYCNGVENYSRILEGRAPGTPPRTLIDYFPKDFLLVIDESHVTVPQVRGMYHGDRSRKNTLVDYGFRLPAARDNRPLTFEEFYDRVGQRVYVSATPSKFELEESQAVVQQIIRPTGLLDPEVFVFPTENQLETLQQAMQRVIEKGERALITTLTKRMAEDLTDYLLGQAVRVRYLHSDIKPLERVEIIRDLRLGTFDVLIGVNLLREGLDLPEVSLVAIMDADKEGFLRSESSLIQTIGRAARNSSGQVYLFADKMTDSMEKAMGETARRRSVQMAFNTKHGIVPKTVKKAISNGLLDLLGHTAPSVEAEAKQAFQLAEWQRLSPEQLQDYATQLESEMREAAKLLEFERAGKLRDQWLALKPLLSSV